jgi:hypothetical protein
MFVIARSNPSRSAARFPLGVRAGQLVSGIVFLRPIHHATQPVTVLGRELRDRPQHRGVELRARNIQSTAAKVAQHPGGQP